ncbi:MAG: hypothetical protein Q7R41_17865 [Phycisphaerales bacterium]|nr:hypothetical protein [Phycisphaerales bacterium]
MKRGVSKSCGCLQREIARARTRTHGESETVEYEIWSGMKKRCYNRRTKSFKDYGGRGIYVCDRWLHDFPAFLADMGKRPSVNHSIDRFPNNDGPYAPDNCRWATVITQRRNRPDNRILNFQGQTLTLSAWADRLHIAGNTLVRRLKMGWSVERTLTTPTRHKQQ